MKLCYSPTSPYVRKVVVCAAELGLSDRIELTPSGPQNAAEVRRDNPLGKVPALLTDAGEALYDSPVICEYLDSLHDGEKLFPASGDARWRALRLQALGDGVLDAALLVVMEGRRPESERSPDFVAFQKRKIGDALDALEADVGELGVGELGVGELGAALDIGAITVGCALGYLDFRLSEDGWRTGRPGLAAWYEDHARRPSMVASVPSDPA